MPSLRSRTSPVSSAWPDQVVDDEVAAQPGREAVRGRVAQEDGGEVVVGQRRQVALRCDLRFTVRRQRREPGVLIEGSAVDPGTVKTA
jgi:hypothetical protein